MMRFQYLSAFLVFKARCLVLSLWMSEHSLCAEEASSELSLSILAAVVRGCRNVGQGGGGGLIGDISST